jgi:hypothetical protein
MSDLCPFGCGKEVLIGQWPFCKGNPDNHSGEIHGMLGEFKPYWDEHVRDDGNPVYITSLAERRREMKAAHLDYAPVRNGMPGREF